MTQEDVERWAQELAEVMGRVGRALGGSSRAGGHWPICGACCQAGDVTLN